MSLRFRVLAALVGLALAAVWPRPGKVDAAEEARFRLVDVAAKAGITRVLLAGRPDKDHLLDSSGGGAAFLDYDRDGRLDVYLVNGWRLEGSKVVEKGRNALYHGKADGSFEDVTDAAGVSGEGQWAQGVAVADYDKDGWPDILVTTFGRNVLYRNLGNGRFQDVARDVGIESPGWNTGASFFDADGDGWLDLYVASYIDVTIEQVLAARPSLSWRGLETVAFGPFGLKGAPDHFFRSDRGKRFVDATLAAGMEDKATGFGFGVRAADLTGDGRVDVYVANDSDPNYLYRNEGGGVFKEVATWSGAALDENGAAQASMGLAFGDVDGDGIPDLFTTNFSEDFSTLYHGLGGGMFEDVSKASGVGAATFKPLSWGTALADLDNDGALDLL
ncbi:MAG: FG-GAP repeat domain-containing protein, partial [Burkholderiales bacterium]